MEKEKLTLSAIFIATYTTLIFSIPATIHNTSMLSPIIYYVFVNGGLFIDLMFFLHISFYALGISSIEKVPYLNITLSKAQIERVGDRFFNFGVYLIFFSLTTPFILIFPYLDNFLGFLIAFIVTLIGSLFANALLSWLIIKLSR